MKYLLLLVLACGGAGVQTEAPRPPPAPDAGIDCEYSPCWVTGPCFDGKRCCGDGTACDKNNTCYDLRQFDLGYVCLPRL